MSPRKHWVLLVIKRSCVFTLAENIIKINYYTSNILFNVNIYFKAVISGYLT
jgi:hypothetical protein